MTHINHVTDIKLDRKNMQIMIRTYKESSLTNKFSPFSGYSESSSEMPSLFLIKCSNFSEGVELSLQSTGPEKQMAV